MGVPRLAARASRTCCMLPLLCPVGLALPGEQDRALHALGVPETAIATSLPKLSKQACLDQLDALPNSLVVPEAGLIWCPNAKAGTTTMLMILQRKLDPGFNVTELTELMMSPRDRMTPAAQERCVDASEMSWEARQSFCARGDALSFTILRNPWERTVSAYLGKVASGTIAPDGDRSHTLSFVQFVQWLSSHGDREEDGSEINIHFMSWCAFAWPCTVLATLLAGLIPTPPSTQVAQMWPDPARLFAARHCGDLGR